MQATHELQGYAYVLLFLIGGMVFLILSLFIGKLIRPSRPTLEKQTTYESGEVTQGMAWSNFNIRFYVIALIFLLFEAEIVFLFPWAVIFTNEKLVTMTHGLWSKITLVEISIFVGVLMIGLSYVWTKGMLAWVKPKIKSSTFVSKIPLEAYHQFYDRTKSGQTRGK